MEPFVSGDRGSLEGGGGWGLSGAVHPAPFDAGLEAASGAGAFAVEAPPPLLPGGGYYAGGLGTGPQEAGPLSGAGGWRADRVDVAAWVLALLSVPLLYAHVVWNEYIERDPTVIPAILWLATPGLLAVLVAWPYRKVSGRCRAALVFGLLGVLAPLVNLALGPVGW